MLHAVTDQEAHWPPPDLHNHILWHAGHSFVLLESLAMEAVGDLPQIPEGWFDIFSWESKPALVASYRWPPLAQIVAELTEQHVRLRQVIEGLSDEQLSHPMPGRGDRTARYAIVHALARRGLSFGRNLVAAQLIRAPAKKSL